MCFLSSLDDSTISDEPLAKDMDYSIPHKAPLDDLMVIFPMDKHFSMHFIDTPSIHEALMSFISLSPNIILAIEDHILDSSSYSFQTHLKSI